MCQKIIITAGYAGNVLEDVLHVSGARLTRIMRDYGAFNRSIYVPSERKERAKTLEFPFKKFTKAESRYLESRGYNSQYLFEHFGVRGGGITGDWKYRIIIPIYFNQKIVSWVARSILPSRVIEDRNIIRYKNLSIEKSIINPKFVFFNLQNSKKDSVILTEGAFDVMRYGDDCICSMGIDITDEQIQLLNLLYKKVYIFFDNEKGAQEKARQLCYTLASIGINAVIGNPCAMFNKNDGGDLTQKEVNEIRSAIGFSY